MPICPFAKWTPITGGVGAHASGPYKIVHHTSEGGRAAGALAAFRAHRSDPHFTVDATTIYQHVDTAHGARALRNAPGGVDTNRDGAIQIEVVGFAHLRKDPSTLTNVARLCRWLEETHDIPREWPSGPPKPAVSGKDPGGHNRDARIWDTRSGHYGHCHVPENSHWDPGYTTDECAFVLGARFDAEGRLIGPPPPPVPARARGRRTPPRVSTMPDHAVIEEEAALMTMLGNYVKDLKLASAQPPPAPARRRAAGAAKRRGPTESAAAVAGTAEINAGSLLSFVDGVGEQEQQDILYSVLLAQRAASGEFNRYTQTQAWYAKYVEVLENLGWASEQFAFSLFDQREGEFRMDQAALAIVTAIATQSQLVVLTRSIEALEKLAEDDGTVRLFDFHASTEGSGNFQLGAVQRADNGALSMAIGAFYFKSLDERRRFLFWKWGAKRVHFWTAAQRMTLNTDFYERQRADVKAMLDADAKSYRAALKLGSR